MTAAAELLPLMQRHWGYDAFRPLQAEAMQAVLDNRDSVVVLPTGGGKSLCYQTPALAMDGVAVVVSPLISLMKDQVDALVANGVSAASVNSTHSVSERRGAADDIRAGRLKLLYLSPERLTVEKTLEFLKSSKISFFAIDEAHCISQWGHDFRPEYRMLSRLKQEFPGVAVHAYTATATTAVRQDIADQLRLSQPLFHVGSFDRPNLLYRVHLRTDILGQVLEVLERHPQQSGIVYCISRKETEEVAAALRAENLRAACYHAGLSEALRSRTQDRFQREEIDIVVATVAFGMGIDKSNVRFVIHAGAPKSLEHYQQESGRAGRDGLDAECCLFYGPRDFMFWKKTIDEMPEEAWPHAKKSLRAIEDYSQGTICRHRALVNYFGQQFAANDCGACDVCLADLDLTPDAKIVAQKILSCVVRVKEGFGAHYVAQVLCGSKEKRILENRHDQLSTYKLLAESGLSAVRMWIEQLVAQKYLERYGDYHQLRVTPLGWTVLKEDAVPRLLQPPATKKKAGAARSAEASWEGVDPGLFESLRQLRRSLAEEKKVPPYIVFDDDTLRELARRRPTSLAAFRQIKGVGDRKAADYGEPFTTAISEYCTANEIPANVTVAPRATSSASGGSNSVSLAKRRAFELLEQGRLIEDIAPEISRALSTTNQYLVEFIENTGRLDPQPWVDAETAARIEETFRTLGETRHKPVFEALNGAATYDQIRIVAACLRNRLPASEQAG